MKLTKEEIIDLKAHPLADKYPMADGAEFSLLKDSIEKHGVQIPIQIYDGKILDGRNRHLAVVEIINENPNWFTEDKVKFEEYKEDEPELYADHLNLVRRHLTAGQKAIIAVKFRVKEFEQFQKEVEEHGKAMSKMKREEQKKADQDPNYVPKPPQRGLTANEKLGGVVGTNKEYIRKALKIKESSPELLEAVYDGSINIDIASKAVGIKVETDEDKVKKDQLIQALLDGKDFTSTKGDIFRSEPNEDKANLDGDLGAFFSFKISPSTIEKIVEVLHNDGYSNQDYVIWVGQDNVTRDAIKALEPKLNIKKHSMVMKHDE